MTGNAINAKSEALEKGEVAAMTDGGGPMGMINQIMQMVQLPQGQG
jgi:hypothetical protein